MQKMQKNEVIMDETKRIEKELKEFLSLEIKDLLKLLEEPKEPNEKKISWQERDYNEGGVF